MCVGFWLFFVFLFVFVWFGLISSYLGPLNTENITWNKMGVIWFRQISFWDIATYASPKEGFAHDDRWSLLSFLHLYVPIHMSPQRTWGRAGKVTVAAYVWLFSAVCFQMCPQSAGICSCIVTLVAFVWFFCSACFHMHLQIVCQKLRR